MPETDVTRRFLRDLERLTVDERRAVARATTRFQHDPRDARLRLHHLQGRDDVWSLSAGFDLRILFVWNQDGTATFIAVGHHDDVY